MKISGLFERAKKMVSRYVDMTPGKVKTVQDPDDFLGNNYESFGWDKYLNDMLQRRASDKIKYADFDLMDEEIPEISTALDVTADFVVFPDNVNHGTMFKVKSKKYQAQVDDVDKVTQFPTFFRSMVREACKYGDNVEELVPNKSGTDVVAFKNVPVDTIIVNMQNGIKNKDPMIVQYDSSNKEIASLSELECLHFSLPTSRKRYSSCGKGVSRIEKARLIYRQLRLMEEGMIIGRLSKANSSYGIVVDVGDLTGDEALNYIEKYRKKISRRKYVDQSTGRLSYKFNPLSVLEDILVPTRQGSGGNIIPLNQNQSRGNIEDINYLQNKMIYAPGVPKLLIGKEEDVNSKSTSETQYVAFLRMIRNIQMWCEPTIKQFYMNALLKRGIKDADDIMVDWPIFGTIDEERKWKILLLKAQIAQVLGRDLSLFDDEYLYDKIFNVPENEKNEMKDRMDAEEDANKDEIDQMFADAEDMSDDEDADMEFASPDDAKQIKKKKKPSKASAVKKEKEYLNYLEGILPPTTMEALKVVMENPVLKKKMYEYIHLTNTKFGAL